jgi:hypothetical protein
MYPKIDVQAYTNNVLHDKNHTDEKKGVLPNNMHVFAKM